MAILHGGPNGAFSGKVGSVVGVVRMGTAIIRGLPRKSRKMKKGSAKQKVCRSRFTELQRFLKPIIPFIRVGFNLEARSRNITAHNAAKSYNMLHAFTPEGEIDCTNVAVTCGNLPGAVNATVASEDLGLQFTWDDNSNDYLAYSDDQVMLLAYDVAGKFQHHMLSGARRSDKKEFLPLHKSIKGREMHVWIAFISDDRELISMSTYLGAVTF